MSMQTVKPRFQLLQLHPGIVCGWMPCRYHFYCRSACVFSRQIKTGGFRQIDRSPQFRLAATKQGPRRTAESLLPDPSVIMLLLPKAGQCQRPSAHKEQ